MQPNAIQSVPRSRILARPFAWKKLLPLRTLRGFQVQMTVIHALILRETRTRFGEHKLGYFWAFFEPVALIATFYGAFTATHHAPPFGMDLVTFLATGLLPYELMTNTAERVTEAINGNRALLYYPQVHRLDLVFARALLESVTVITVFIVIMGAHAAYVGRLEIEDPLGVMWTLLLGSLFGTTLGLNFCMLGVVTQTIDRLRGPIMRPLFWISGIFFTYQNVPAELQRYVLANPLFHVNELLRAAWFRTYEAPHASAAYVIQWILVMGVTGLLLELAVRSKIEVG